MMRIAVISLLLLSSAASWAQGVALGATSLSTTRFLPEVRLWSDSFISSDYEATTDRSFNFIGTYLRTPKYSESIVKADIDGAFALDAPLLSYLNFSQVYLDLPLSGNETSSETRLYVGRKKSSWSEVDSRWDLGLWEPVFKWNPLTPQGQGLTGIFLSAAWPYFEFEVMGSPLYLPDQGPSFAVNEEGNFERGNPWFQRPADTIQIWSETSRVKYNFQRPNETQIVMQKTYAARVKGQYNSFYVQGSYAYKPMNQLALGYDGALDIGTDRGVVEILPAVQYHRLLGGDIGWQGETFHLGVSGLHDSPEGEAPFEDREKWTRPVYSEATVTSPFVDVKLMPGLKVKFQYLNINGGEITETGPLASPHRRSVTKRYSFTEAQKVELVYGGREWLKRPWRTSLSYTYSDREKFDILRWQGQLYLTRLWSVFAETLLVRALDSDELHSEVTDFENHDRVLVGLGYVF